MDERAGIQPVTVRLYLPLLVRAGHVRQEGQARKMTRYYPTHNRAVRLLEPTKQRGEIRPAAPPVSVPVSAPLTLWSRGSEPPSKEGGSSRL